MGVDIEKESAVNNRELYMRFKIYIHALGIWFIFLIFAIFNGIIRNIFLEPILGGYPAHLISVGALAGFVLIVTYIFIKHSRLRIPAVDLYLIGLLWALITALFEFGFGHYVMGNSWDSLIADYDIARGRLWVLILLCELLAPAVFSMTIKKHSHQKRNSLEPKEPQPPIHTPRHDI
ncbi:conserved membrane hypothetical protein [Candidatus Zixiibacteriota bacterium]|nr:conserved membrane hypothetical protein [candidate division Zixibacteria bacterium]